MPTILNERGDAQYNVQISIPSGDEVKARFALDLARLIGYSNRMTSEVRTSLEFCRMSILPYSRHLLVEHAIDRGFSHVLFLDSDMGFPPYVLEKLLAHKQPIVGCNYPTRVSPHQPTTALENNEHVYTTNESSGLQEVTRIGFGCVLIDTDVFKAVPKPWFSMPWVTSGGYVGEDVFFCHMANKHGFKVMVDHDLSTEIAHVGEYVFDWRHAIATRPQPEKEAA